MIVRFTGPARADLVEIATYLEGRNPSAAQRVAARIESRCASLARFPERGSVMGRTLNVELRRLVEYPYLIVYSVLVDEVRIQRILHFARDTRTLFDEIAPDQDDPD